MPRFIIYGQIHQKLMITKYFNLIFITFYFNKKISLHIQKVIKFCFYVYMISWRLLELLIV